MFKKAKNLTSDTVDKIKKTTNNAYHRMKGDKKFKEGCHSAKEAAAELVGKAGEILGESGEMIKEMGKKL
ncbi:hypothetical protein LOAG_09713 [Loa loa]|uniref:MT0933-like antitoxin protein n=1 Tax=Loa loa TaxID=7209 RepID=A0A1I7VEZ8_LOALO|nr:hypothetical protein LOAG_09713 [Loa loa]EFO18782.2 hypothetical protein LOAG_09713 [Loa loa]